MVMCFIPICCQQCFVASVINVISLNKEHFLLVYIAVCLHIQFIGSLCDHHFFIIHTFRYLIIYCGKLHTVNWEENRELGVVRLP